MKKSILMSGTLLMAQFSMALPLESIGGGTCRLNVYKSSENVALELNVGERKHTIYIDAHTYQKISGLSGAAIETNLRHQIQGLKNITLADPKDKRSRTLVGSNLSLLDVSDDHVAMDTLSVSEFRRDGQTRIALHSRIDFDHSTDRAHNSYYENVTSQIVFKKSDDGKFETPHLIVIDSKSCLLK